MREMKLQASLKEWAVWRVAVSFLLAISSISLASQTPPPDLFSITKPAIASPAGKGWQVDPRLGRLAVNIPIGEMPGEISFPVSASISGAEIDRPWSVGGVGGFERIFINGYLNIFRVEMMPNGATYALEDGRTYSYPDDFTETSARFDSLLGTSSTDPLFQAYGFTRPADRSKWLVSADGKMIRFSVSITYDFGIKYNGLIKSLNVSPDVIKTTCATLPFESFVFLEYLVLMDRDRARVFAAYNYKRLPNLQGETGAVYMPLCIVDRFGHYTTMQWSNGGPVRRLDVRNQRGQGFTVRMNTLHGYDYPKDIVDLARIDFVGFRGPSVTIKGYSPNAPWATYSQGYYHHTRSVNALEMIGRPTEIKIGCSESLTQPAWSDQFGAASAPLRDPYNSGIDSSVRKWLFNYLGFSGSRLHFIIDPGGVRSLFQYQNYTTYQIPTSGSPLLHTVAGVKQVDQADFSSASGATRRITWDRIVNVSPTIPNAISVTQRDWWNPDLETNDRYALYQYGDPAGSTNAVDAGNGFLTKWSKFSINNTELESLLIKSGTYGIGCGLNLRLSVPALFIHAKQGGPTRYDRYNHNDWPNHDTRLNRIDTRISPAGSYNWKVSQGQSFTYANTRGMLAPEQIVTSNIYRVNLTAGGLLPPGSRGTTNTWDTGNLFQLKEQYSDFGPARDGTQFTYDAEGRLSTQQVYYTVGGNRLPWNTITTSYSVSNGKPWLTQTDYSVNGSISPLYRTQGDFDHGQRPRNICDERSVSTHFEYDLFGRPLVIQKSGEAPISLSYPDEWTKITTQASKTTKEFFDGFGRLVKQELWAGGIMVRTTVPTYDLHNRVMSVLETNAAGATRTRATTYDLQDRVVSEVSFAGRRTDFAYTSEGLNSVITQAVDPLGLNFRTIIKKDFWGQIVSVQAPNGDVTAYTYDGLGNKTSTTITPAGGGAVQTRTFTYDDRGRLISKWEPETGNQTFGNFNPLNQAQTVTEVGLNPANPARVRTLAYDGLGRLRSQTNGDASETFTYQGAFLIGTSRTMGSDAVLQGFAYSGPGRRLSNETTMQGAFSAVSQYAYDTQGRLETLTYPSGSVVGYAYDPLDRVQAVTYNGQGLVPQVTYDDWGNPRRRQFTSGAMDEWTYDPSGTHVSKWDIGTVGGLPESRSYDYDNAERLIKAGEWTSLAYDAKSRLIQATGFGLTNVLSHDAYTNNISSVTTSEGEVPSTLLNFTFNPMVDNHVPGETTNGGFTQAEKTNFGETTILGTGISSDGAMAMEWDPLGRMAYSHLMWGPTESYRYTASGLRVAKVNTQDAGQNRNYAYTNTGQLLSEYTAHTSPVWTRDVVYLGSLAIAEIDASGTHELHSDHLGSPRVITGSEGTVEGTQVYGPYGELIQQTGYIPLTGYTGHLQTEPTGLIYMRGRFYSPAWHRFMNSDQGVDPGGLNQFAYVAGNPLMTTDSSGMKQDAYGPEGSQCGESREKSREADRQTREHDREMSRERDRDKAARENTLSKLKKYDSSQPPSLAQIGSRKLENFPAEVGKLRHDQIRYNDGTDIGFLDDGIIGPDYGHTESEYNYDNDSRFYDGDTMHEAVGNVRENWDLDWRGNNHCQDFADAARGEHDRLRDRTNNHR